MKIRASSSFGVEHSSTGEVVVNDTLVSAVVELDDEQDEDEKTKTVLSHLFSEFEKQLSQQPEMAKILEDKHLYLIRTTCVVNYETCH